MLPVIALVGRPNVGKSTLFNCLTRSRAALVADYPGLTRDRQYGEGQFNDCHFIVIDTGGLAEDDLSPLDKLMVNQARQAIAEADSLLFVVDGKAGLTAADELLARQLRRCQKPLYLVVNKTDGVNPDLALAEFAPLGLGQPWPIAATQRRGIKGLLNQMLAATDGGGQTVTEQQYATQAIKVAVIGRPNVGKSTLVNRLLGEQRVVVYDSPGTTRDAIYIPYQRQGQDYVLIDTAGIRRRSKVDQWVEKFSIVKTLQAIHDAHVVVFIIDGRQGLVDQDLHLLGLVLKAGRAMVLAVNKWDGLAVDERTSVRQQLDRRLTFLSFANRHFISALQGSGINQLYGSIKQAYASATQPLATPELTAILQQLVSEHQPPMIQGRRIKLRYAHSGGHCPPTIVIHGKQTDKLPAAYRRYLINSYQQALQLQGTPVRLVLRTDDNPYQPSTSKTSGKKKSNKK